MSHHTPKTQSINTDKAYLLGLIVGGGEIIGQRLKINLPYRNWGDLKINPARGGEISEYIIRVAKPVWDSEYDMDITYSVLNGSWQIAGTVTGKLMSDLQSLGLPDRGDFRDASDLSVLVSSLNNQEKIKRFLAGLTDTVGSLAPSHRHRVDSLQIISYEFTGKNFRLIAQIIGLFDAIGCYPNQVLWNHPNFHSSTDRYYMSWKKGFKLRVALGDYMLAGSFVSEAKKMSAEENMTLADPEGSDAHPAGIRINGRTCLHFDENSSWLPDYVRGKHYVHFLHLANDLGVPVSAPSLKYLSIKLSNAKSLVSPFTLLTKGTKEEIERIIASEAYLRQTTYSKVDLPPGYLSQKLRDNTRHILGMGDDKGFPVNQIVHAVTFVALAETGGKNLMGKRIRGARLGRFYEAEPRLAEIGVEIMKPDKGTCLLVRSANFAALVGYEDDAFNDTLIDYDAKSMALRIREPNFNECVDLV